MFTNQMNALMSSLSGLSSNPVAQALVQVFGNCAQELDHRGPVNISSYGQQPTLELNQGMPNQTALQVDNGNVNIGPVGANPPGTGGQVTFNDPVTFNGQVTLNNQTIAYDDIAFADADLIFKYCSPGFGSTIARVKLDGPLTDGSGPAHVIDCDGNNVTNNASGQGGDGGITVHDCSGSADDCGTEGDCGYAIYMSDCYPHGGAAVDCVNRPNGGHWELIRIKRKMDDGVCEVDVVDNVCCIDGQIIVCKKTIHFPEPVTVTTPHCDCPP